MVPLEFAPGDLLNAILKCGSTVNVNEHVVVDFSI